MLKDNLKRLREQAHMTQRELAETVGCTQSNIAHYEKGFRECPSNVLVRIADALHCSADELLGLANLKTE